MRVKFDCASKASLLTALMLIPIACSAQSLIAGSASSPIKIMCLGDSITAGYKGAPGEGGYRSALAQKLTTASCQFQFVGSRQDNSSKLPPTAQANDGFVGYTLEPFSGESGLYDPSQIDSPVSDVTIYHPDVILLLAGTDNLNLGQSAGDAIAQYDDLLKRILVIAPNAIVIVGAVPHSATHDAAVVKFNSELSSLVDTLQNRNYKIHFVAGTALPKSTLSGGVYPTQAGYDEIGSQLFGMISRL